jgi:hypothetical protein
MLLLALVMHARMIASVWQKEKLPILLSRHARPSLTSAFIRMVGDARVRSIPELTTRWKGPIAAHVDEWRRRSQRHSHACYGCKAKREHRLNS